MRRLAVLFAALLVTACASVTPPPDETLREALVRHVETLASDRFAGRAPATAGEDRTLAYLESEWRAMGLESGTHDPANPWRAPFRFSVDGTTWTTHNLIGRIRGYAPASGAVLLLAHWDHLGAAPGACVKLERDRVCNGAVDNASGVAIITEVARRIAAGPPLARDVYVMATGAEERGLLGTRAFTDNPPVPLRKFVAAFNVDTEGVTPAVDSVVVIGDQESPLLALVAQVVRAHGITLADPGEANRLYGRRQDGAALAEAGVPAAMVSATFADLDAVNAFLESRYHQPGDEIDAVQFGSAVTMVELHVDLVRAAADPRLYSPLAAAEESAEEGVLGGTESRTPAETSGDP